MNQKAMKSLVPIPPQEMGLPIIMAEPWLQVIPEPNPCPEAPAFDREGNLYCTSVVDGRVFKISQDKRVSTIFSNKAYMFAGCAIHKDGRLFLVAVSGQVVSMNPDGRNLVEIDARYDGKPLAPDDIVFDDAGNFYVTDLGDLRGPIGPTGGVYRFSADLRTVHPIMQNLVTANGISLGPKGISMPSPFPVGYELWVSESVLNRMIHLRLQEDGITPAHPSVNVTYYFSGDSGPDSNAVDGEGNIYQTLAGQGRIVVLNRAGIPVAQILMPGRDEGRNLLTTNVAFRPGTNEGYVTAGSTDGGWIHRFPGLAKGLILFSHQ